MGEHKSIHTSARISCYESQLFLADTFATRLGDTGASTDIFPINNVGYILSYIQAKKINNEVKTLFLTVIYCCPISRQL